MNITTYSKHHMIVDIGTALHAELIVDDPNGFIDVSSKSAYYISSIRWWDRVSIENGSLIGYGGPRDPRDPNSYYFAETDLCKTFSLKTTLQEYYEYINYIRQKFSDYDLYPAFEVKLRDNRDDCMN